MLRMTKRTLGLAAAFALALPVIDTHADVLNVQDGLVIDSLTYAGTESNWMREEVPGTALTNNTIMRVGQQGAGATRRSVIRFSGLSTLDLGFTSAQIVSARLLLTTDTAFEGAGDAELRVLGASDNNWVENEVSWTNKATSTPWAGGGGAGANYGGVIDTVSWTTISGNPSPLNTQLAFDLTGDALNVVKGWVDGSNVSASFILRAASESGTNYVDFYSEDFATTPSFRPMLEITYVIPEPASMALVGLGGAMVLVGRRQR